MSTLFRRLTAVGRDHHAVALIEFALVLPLLVLLGLTGAEYANFITTKMRISQIALMVADNGSRMGSDQNGSTAVSETDIQDTFTGAQIQSAALDMKTNGRIILSQLEPVASPNTTGKYKITWQRCYGAQTHASLYGVQGATNLVGIGPVNQQVTAADYNATMFVEVYYAYKPLISAKLIPRLLLDETASMAVRDSRLLGTPVDPSNVGTGTACS
ncbi:TadE/TadG family type IV pilus assembly protein [Sphingomonas abietis]|uniref:TadE/TadG family type IV pilus assembly protein n=1 Tax=Sphingomonas abietis TaxID=3012344 RepID=A0ABY7NKV7_9SPHN|nr:TadE/TadG family type IV pilus assembly protein [Sphingomonas abietis]WBO21253.1 TadE/TadG family type IV pilus assembly protein [Sphingomonas abietis]